MYVTVSLVQELVVGFRNVDVQTEFSIVQYFILVQQRALVKRPCFFVLFQY
jgi:hypothetical protein